MKDWKIFEQNLTAMFRHVECGANLSTTRILLPGTTARSRSLLIALLTSIISAEVDGFPRHAFFLTGNRAVSFDEGF